MVVYRVEKSNVLIEDTFSGNNVGGWSQDFFKMEISFIPLLVLTVSQYDCNPDLGLSHRCNILIEWEFQFAIPGLFSLFNLLRCEDTAKQLRVLVL